MIGPYRLIEVCGSQAAAAGDSGSAGAAAAGQCDWVRVCISWHMCQNISMKIYSVEINVKLSEESLSF